MKNLIMGYATNCKFDDFYRFVSSARQYCHLDEVDIVVFINALGDEFANTSLEKNITLIPVENVWKWVNSSKNLNIFYQAKILLLRVLIRVSPESERTWFKAAYRNTVASWIHPQAGRWMAYYTFLKVNSCYQMIMLSDVRDVIFQSSPFDYLDSNKLHVFEQTGVYYGRQDEDNIDTKWFNCVYGKTALKGVFGKVTLCSGTLLGENQVMMQFLELMDIEIQRHPRKPLDQAIFNEVINNQFQNNQLVRHNLKNGVVLTLFGGDDEEYWEIIDNKVVVDARVVPVIHMYDRNPRTKDLFFIKIPIPKKQPVI